MPDIGTTLYGLLLAVDRPGDFYTSGTAELRPPSFTVEGVGPVALPLLPAQAQQLIAVAQQAPYGKGEATLVDTNVRRTWQLDSAKVHIAGKGWARTLAEILAAATAGLGVTDPVEAQLYKVLIYDEGGFFVDHRDTEKVPGMFATLVVVLPSDYRGGELVVRHQGREERLDLHSPDPAEVAFAAFYADCVHEVLPVTAGYRLTLIYNLVRTGKGELPRPPDFGAVQAQVAALLRGWAAGEAGEAGEAAPRKLILPLEHAYTPAELSFAGLKNADAAVADVVVGAAEQTDCEVWLALVTKTESGSAEYTGGWGWRGSSQDRDDFEEVEVIDCSEVVSDWCAPDGSEPGFGEVPFDDDELCPPGAFDDLEPDDEEFQEATGNEGASFERTYQRAALVLWPRQWRFAVLSAAGLAATLPWLEEMVGQWEAGGEGQASPRWQEAARLAEAIVRGWSGQDEARRDAARSGHTARLLASLTRLRDTRCIELFVEGPASAGSYAIGDNPALVRALALLPPPRAAALLRQVVAGNGVRMSATCADLLEHFTAVAAGAEVVPAARALIESLPGDPARPALAPYSWPAPEPATPALVVSLLTALHRLGAADLAVGTVELLLARPAAFDPDRVLLGAAVTLFQREETRASPGAQRLRAALLDHLRARIAAPLEPPGDWRRDSKVTCSCSHCADLSRFLAAADQSTWVLKAIEAQRRHVEETIRRSGCDVDCTTDRRGRPYGLMCRKTQASYQRRVAQREQDLADWARLEGG